MLLLVFPFFSFTAHGVLVAVALTWELMISFKARVYLVTLRKVRYRSGSEDTTNGE